jgi:hypothetical protein
MGAAITPTMGLVDLYLNSVTIVEMSSIGPPRAMDSGVRTRHLKAKILSQLHPTTVGGYERLDRKDSLTRSLYNNIKVNGIDISGCTSCNTFTPPEVCIFVASGCTTQYCDRHQF